MFYGCLDIAIVNSCINWKESKSVDITFHEFLIDLIEEMKSPVGWWEKTQSDQNSSQQSSKKSPIVNPSFT